MATYTHAVESVKESLKYGGIYCPKLLGVMSEGVKHVLDADSLTIGPTQQVEGIVDGEKSRFEDWTRTLEARAQRFFTPDRLASPDLLNRHLVAYAYLIQTEPSKSSEYFQRLKELHLLIEEGEPRADPNGKRHTLLELSLPDDEVHYWHGSTRFVYREVPLARVRAVHTRNIEIAKEQLQQLGIALPLKLLK